MLNMDLCPRGELLRYLTCLLTNLEPSPNRPMVTQQEKLNAVFSALSDPTRRKIIERLSRDDEIPVTSLAKPFRMSLPAISRHVRVLEDAKLVSRQRTGRVHNIRVNEDGLKEAQKWIAQYVQIWEARFAVIDETLKRNKAKRKNQ